MTDIRNRLMPVMYQNTVSRNMGEMREWASMRLDELKKSLSCILPLDEHEYLFIERIRNEGVISPELMTNDPAMAKIIRAHPAINWVVKKQQEKI